jgi:hypothetical protein
VSQEKRNYTDPPPEFQVLRLSRVGYGGIAFSPGKGKYSLLYRPFHTLHIVEYFPLTHKESFSTLLSEKVVSYQAIKSIQSIRLLP